MLSQEEFYDIINNTDVLLNKNVKKIRSILGQRIWYIELSRFDQIYTSNYKTGIVHDCTNTNIKINDNWFNWKKIEIRISKT